AADLGLLRPAPQRADPHDLAAEVLHELGEESDGGAGADQVLDDEHLGALADQPVELGGQGDPALAAAHALGAVDEDRAGGMGPVVRGRPGSWWRGPWRPGRSGGWTWGGRVPGAWRRLRPLVRRRGMGGGGGAGARRGAGLRGRGRWTRSRRWATGRSAWR